MFEKPFAIGQQIKVKDVEGTVEKVGFRSTQIRTLYDSLVTIPSSQLVNSTIDNLELRNYREVKTVLNLAYDTPVEKRSRHSSRASGNFSKRILAPTRISSRCSCTHSGHTAWTCW